LKGTARAIRKPTVERELSQPEGDGLKVIRKIIDGGLGSLTFDERQDLAWYIGFQWARVPAQRSAFDQLADLFSKLQVAAGGPNALREHLETAGKKPTDQEVDELWTAATDFDSYSVKADQNAQIATALQLATSIAPVLAEMPWALQKFERRRLLTSDRPIGINRFPQNSDPFMGVGFGTADVIWFGSVALLERVARAHQLQRDSLVRSPARVRRMLRQASLRDVHRPRVRSGLAADPR
jgi:hypothetical protein